MSDLDRKERDRKYLEGVINGNKKAFENLFHAYYEDLCRFATGYISSPEEAEDLVQDIFFSIWKRRQELDSQQSIRGYLYTATRNEALKRLNTKKRRSKSSKEQKKLQERSLKGDPEQVLRHKELEAVAQKALRALSERQREVFLLSRQHGLTYAEIADILSISIKTVETHMGRALSSLENHFPDLVSE